MTKPVRLSRLGYNVYRPDAISVVLDVSVSYDGDITLCINGAEFFVVSAIDEIRIYYPWNLPVVPPDLIRAVLKAAAIKKLEV